MKNNTVKQRKYISVAITTVLLAQSSFANSALICKSVFESSKPASEKQEEKVKSIETLLGLVEANAPEKQIEEALIRVSEIDPKDLVDQKQALDEKLPLPKNLFIEKMKSYGEKIRFAPQRIKDFTKSVLKLRQDVHEEMNRASLDEYVYAFYGFHNRPEDRHYYMRKWKGQDAITKIDPTQVNGLPVEDYAMAARIAMEIEAPTFDYSDQSGESFRYLIPNVARYMGQNKNQQAHSEKLARRVCVSSWCAEESRHAGFLSQVVKRLTGKAPDESNPEQADVHASDEASAIAHLGTRQTYEWNATSTYFFLLAHSEGPLRDSMKLILRDEIKHLVLMSSAYKYMYGYRPWKRFSIILKNGLEALKHQSNSRSDGANISANKAALLKFLLAHLFTEVELRKYLKTLPANTLAKFFDGQSQLPDLPQVGITEARKEEIIQLQEKYKSGRLNFDWWPKSQGDQMRAQNKFENENLEIINKIVQEKLNDFIGSELANSDQQLEWISKIEKVVQNTNPQLFNGDFQKNQLANILFARLRDHQIHNNQHEVEVSQKNESIK